MTEEEHNRQIEESNRTKIIITAVISVLIGFAFILALVNFGMAIQRDFDANKKEEEKKSDVVAILGVDYSAESFTYTAPTPMTAGGETTPKNVLFNRVGVSDEEASYYVIDSSDKLNSVLSAIAGLSGDTKGYTVSSDFFRTGSVILVNSESVLLESLKVTAVARDDNYNVQIDVKETNGTTPAGGDMKRGGAVLVKIPNIQPKSVEVKKQ